MARVTIFGAGAMGTALAIHLAGRGEAVTIWGSRFDARVLPSLRDRRTHPALSEHLPNEVRVLDEDALEEAGRTTEIAVLAANSNGARSLGRMVAPGLRPDVLLVSIAKGLEPGSATRISEVYREELGDRPVVAVGGPALAPEVADGLPTASIFASDDPGALAETSVAFRTSTYLVDESDDIVGVELCGTAKNVAAIGSGICEGLGKIREIGYKNARAALFARAVGEMAQLVGSYGGRAETAHGLAGAGDLVVTSIGGRNRAYGEAVGLGATPQHALEDMKERGMTVEGVDSAHDVHVLAEKAGLDLRVHETVYRIVHEGAPPATILEAL